MLFTCGTLHNYSGGWTHVQCLPEAHCSIIDPILLIEALFIFTSSSNRGTLQVGGHMYTVYLWDIAQLFRWVDTCMLFT
jgi:hypothetical protein